MKEIYKVWGVCSFYGFFHAINSSLSEAINKRAIYHNTFTDELGGNL